MTLCFCATVRRTVSTHSGDTIRLTIAIDSKAQVYSYDLPAALATGGVLSRLDSSSCLMRWASCWMRACTWALPSSSLSCTCRPCLAALPSSPYCWMLASCPAMKSCRGEPPSGCDNWIQWGCTCRLCQHVKRNSVLSCDTRTAVKL